MNRTSKHAAEEAAETLLEAGRTQPELHYDVELGLERHHHWLRHDAPMPEWAGASAGAAATSLLPIAIKTIVSALLMGVLGVALWQARGRLQPSAAETTPSSPSAERVQDVAAPESDAWLAHTPIPVPDQGALTDQAPHRVLHADAPNKRSPRSHKDRAASARASGAEPTRSAGDARATEAISARIEPATSASEDNAPQAATPPAAPEPKPITAAQRPRPEPGSQAQAPDDLTEMKQVATAEQWLERSPERALALVRQGDQRFAHGYFQQERAYIAIMALIRLGRVDEARARAERFAKQFPPLPYGARIRSALEARDTP